MLLLIIPVALLAGLAKWALYPPPLDVSITVEPFSFPRYDDHAGNLGMAAVVQITNLSKSTVWIYGPPREPASVRQQLVDGKWESSMSFGWSPPDTPQSKLWMPLRPMEPLTILAGSISERATEMRVGLPFTTERLAPATTGHWVFSPVVKIVKRGQDYFPETKPGAQQEEQFLWSTRPSELSQPTNSPHP
ncbi:MAG TPA: hypothetical protein VN699_08840 [Pirellulales bacterium]|nr:hypothetical protein [Pirellulales bacterium]